jgi:hypothetical protein
MATVATVATVAAMTTDSTITPAGAPKGSRVAAPTRGKTSRAKRHPLLGAFPLAVMTLATFLVVFAIMMARLQGGLDPALRAGTSGTTVVRNVSGGKVVTRASGTASPASSPSGTPTRQGTTVLTRTSGAGGFGVGGEGDDA